MCSDLILPNQLTATAIFNMFALESVNETQYFQRALLSETTHPVLAFPKQPEGFSDFRYYTIPELKSLADAAASWYVSNGIHSRKEGQKPLVVASCARGDIDWIIAFYAIMRLGHTFAGSCFQLAWLRRTDPQQLSLHDYPTPLSLHFLPSPVPTS